jgi:spore coat polysaccharide biosynthesis protein SpsF
MKTLVIIQARNGSSRLPGKVMMPLAGKPLLERMVERVMAARTKVDLVATTESSDEPILSLCREIGVDCYRGHPTDLLDRHYRAARERNAEAVAKIPSDCPLIDPAVIDRVLSMWSDAGNRFDYVSNLHPATYPDGNDVEILSFDTLKTAWQEATKDFEREHTTPYIWERRDRFRIGNVEWETGFNYSMTHRWTIDYPEDYQFIKTVYDNLFDESNPIFSLEQILALVREHPEIHAINSMHAGVNWYHHHLKELRTISESETIQPATRQ